MLKVLWIADFNISQNSGGAQVTDNRLISYGKQLGYNIEYFNYNSQDDILAREFDIVISGNLENLHKRQNVLEFLLSHPRHYRLEHDANAYLTQEIRQSIFSSTIINFFLTDYHLDMFKSRYGNIFNKVEIVPDPIDTNLFFNKNLTRKQETLYVGFMHPLKGTYGFLEHALLHPNERFAVAGWGSPSIEKTIKFMPNVNWLGKIEYDKMPDLFNTYSTLYYKPIGFEPFCRSVGEALLCGMNIEASNNIGSLHDFKKYGYEEFKNRCKDAPNKFWNLIEGKK